MDAVSLLAHLMFKTFFLALPVGVAWLAFRRLSMSESQNAWLYSGVGLFASISAATLAPWALGFTGASWIVLLTALMCPALWIATVLLCDLRERSYGDDEATDWVIERFTSRRSLPAETPAPLVLPESLRAEEQSPPVFRHKPRDIGPAETSVENKREIASFEPSLMEAEQELFFETSFTVPTVEPSVKVSAATVEVAEEPSVEEIAPINEPTEVVKNAFLGNEVEAPRQNEVRRVLDVARDMRGDGVSRERLMQKTKKRSHDMAIIGSTA